MIICENALTHRTVPCVTFGIGAGIDVHVNQSMTKPLIDKTTTIQDACKLIYDVLDSIPFINRGDK